MHETASLIATSAGYEVIGLDHFVLKDDPLYIALRESTLHRNFQGYCPKEISGQVYALGVTGISQLEGSYAQNIKTIPEYYASIDRGELPTHIGTVSPMTNAWHETSSMTSCATIRVLHLT
ncbi:hypothetical protein [Porphyromonas cangingivalis]|uniref:hypothetical protein n=1 Tax=Porphyromonas cangingivalis TaxID=36874 RepID=UPI0006877685|nr:hypothetical protein [Porphyromonas cangingivalis]